jgi:hypothetical protein
MYKYIAFEDDFDEPTRSSFNNTKKIDYYKSYSLSSNTYTYIVINKNIIQNAINNNNKYKFIIKN